MSWSENLKNSLRKGKRANCNQEQFRRSLYRPFCQQWLYFDTQFVERRYLLQRALPIPEVEAENRLIWIKTGSEVPFFVLPACVIPNGLPQGASQCFPFYTYDEDGTNRRENITDWALAEFRSHYGDSSISKRDIFHYTYGLLHHPEYRTRYAANLKRELPRIPKTPEFRRFAEIGAALMALHIGYETQAEYPLQRTETGQLDWRVEKMVLSKDKTQLKYNEFLTLSGIPPEAQGYRLGNRSALEWVVDQYRVSTDSRSGIANDPNRQDDPEYIVRLVGQVVTVSVETVRLVRELAGLSIDQG
jgi:predicted helicase